MLLTACSTKEEGSPPDSGAPSASAAATDAGAGAGMPAGLSGYTDAGAAPTDAKYTPSGGGWEVTTGPAHIVYSANDTASGAYTVSTTIDQLENPAHPEAFGLFIGGTNLGQSDQRYTYMVVRGTGEALVNVMEGRTPRRIMEWTANPAVPKADGAGKASYRLAIAVGKDSVRFMVNDKAVSAAPRSAVSADGVAGLRVNHNLHVRVMPVTITR